MVTKQWFMEQKSKSPCVHCGETDVSLLTYHHRDPRLKEYDIANLISRGVSIKKLAQEMKKCNVLCVTCHRRVHGHIE